MTDRVSEVLMGPCNFEKSSNKYAPKNWKKVKKSYLHQAFGRFQVADNPISGYNWSHTSKSIITYTLAIIYVSTFNFFFYKMAYFTQWIIAFSAQFLIHTTRYVCIMNILNLTYICKWIQYKCCSQYISHNIYEEILHRGLDLHNSLLYVGNSSFAPKFLLKISTSKPPPLQSTTLLTSIF